ncbi:MAG: hypothetical protein ACK4TO_02580 [Candidatus Nitrosotenuis sp.]
MSKSIVEKKQELEQTENISVCDVFKESTTAIIEKLESQVPLYLQNYSDLYMEYLKSIDNMFGTCYISQKEFFDKLGIDQNTLKASKDLWKTATDLFLTQIDMAMNFQKLYVKTRIETIKYFNQNTTLLMNNYAKMLGQLNELSEK